MHLNRLEFQAALAWLQQRFPPFRVGGEIVSQVIADI
jgi:hypothetical protein